MRVTERRPPLHEPLREVRRGGRLGVRRRAHPVEVEGRRLDHPGDRAEREPHLVDGVEQRLLVLLEVAVVAEAGGP
jgi:hypothetical protein